MGRATLGTVAPPSASSSRRIFGRYALYEPIASGGMATVHFGRLLGPAAFARMVAIKRLHEQFARDPELAARFLEEAELATRIRHANVVPTLDVVAEGGEVLLVMEYVHGESLARLLRKAGPTAKSVACAIGASVLHGLHAVHTAKNAAGEPLGIVHRDVSPHNVIVGADGVARLIDFGIAKRMGELPVTREDAVRGKLAYMAPEQVRRLPLDARTDVYASSVVLWEALTGRRLFAGEEEAAILEQVLIGLVDPPSKYVPEVDDRLDAIVLRGLDRDPARRFETARAMALALEEAVPPAPASVIGAWVEATAAEALAERARTMTRIEQDANAPPRLHANGRRARVFPVLVVAAGAAIALFAAAATRTRRPAADATLPEGVAAPPQPRSVPDPPPDPRPPATAATDPPPRATSTAPADRKPARAVPRTKKSCETIDPVTGDVHFSPDCR
jgi:eukaryotic-like serine/threonine-protein kinase